MSTVCLHCEEPIEQRPPLGWMHSEGKGSWVTGPGYKYATPRPAAVVGAAPVPEKGNER